ncbi:MAG: hypothetical protein K0U41_00510, partial [Gammaproteobacteria bacterium]|nr:hypothetical protein [Gammaproteobacteria bacterium]
VITTKRSTKKFSQVLNYVAELDYTISVWSDGDFHMQWDNNAQMKSALSGRGSDDIAGATFFRGSTPPAAQIEEIVAPFTTSLAQTIYFDKALSGDVQVTSTTLEAE